MKISLKEAFPVWLKIALLSFGGPAGQMGVMHRLLVEEKRWVDEKRFLEALNFCMLLPGPEAQQLSLYLGFLLHGVRGGVLAGTLFILPGFISILALSFLYAAYQQQALLQALFLGFRCAVVVIVLEALFRIGSRTLASVAKILIAASAFAALFFFQIPFPLVIAAAALCGAFFPVGGREKKQPKRGGTLRPALAALALWLIPLALLLLALGPQNVFSELGLFFSKMAVVSFGGAYAVLTYVAQQAVEQFGWLSPKEMLDGLSMAETTPGPLIQVVQFVGFMAAFRDPGPLNPYLAGTLASLWTTWVTFLPSFFWIFLAAPYIERLRSNARLNGALSFVTAAVVGVILNLALWFALNTLTTPSAVLIAAVAAVALFRLKWGIVPTLLLSGILGSIL